MAPISAIDLPQRVRGGCRRQVGTAHPLHLGAIVLTEIYVGAPVHHARSALGNL